MIYSQSPCLSPPLVDFPGFSSTFAAITHNKLPVPLPPSHSSLSPTALLHLQVFLSPGGGCISLRCYFDVYFPSFSTASCHLFSLCSLYITPLTLAFHLLDVSTVRAVLRSLARQHYFVLSVGPSTRVPPQRTSRNSIRFQVAPPPSGHHAYLVRPGTSFRHLKEALSRPRP